MYGAYALLYLGSFVSLIGIEKVVRGVVRHALQAEKLCARLTEYAVPLAVLMAQSIVTLKCGRYKDFIMQHAAKTHMYYGGWVLFCFTYMYCSDLLVTYCSDLQYLALLYVAIPYPLVMNLVLHYLPF